MSEETVQFVEMVRLAAAKLAKKQPAQGNYPMYCEACGCQTNHALTVSGDWEIYACACGTQKRYRVK